MAVLKTFRNRRNEESKDKYRQEKSPSVTDSRHDGTAQMEPAY